MAYYAASRTYLSMELGGQENMLDDGATPPPPSLPYNSFVLCAFNGRRRIRDLKFPTGRREQLLGQEEYATYSSRQALWLLAKNVLSVASSSGKYFPCEGPLVKFRAYDWPAVVRCPITPFSELLGHSTSSWALAFACCFRLWVRMLRPPPHASFHELIIISPGRSLVKI